MDPMGYDLHLLTMNSVKWPRSPWLISPDQKLGPGLHCHEGQHLHQVIPKAKSLETGKMAKDSMDTEVCLTHHIYIYTQPGYD